MLIGTYEHRIDSKGRLVMPAPFREELGAEVVASIGFDRCVSVYSIPRWNELLEKFQRLSFSKGKSRDFLRILLATAHQVPIDGSGRVLIVPTLRDHGKLQQEVNVVGVGDHLEIWDRETWNSYRDRVMADFSDIAEEVEGL